MYGSQYLLPRDSIGYQGISSLIWDGGDISKISEEQMSALMEWVNCGGRLFLFVGDNWQYMKGTELERAMGLQFVGSRLINLDNENDREDEQKKPVVVSIVEGLDGWKTLVTLENIPFIANKEIGMGRVYYLASRFTEDMPYQDVVINLVKNERAESVFCFARGNDCDEMLTSGMNQISKRFKIKLPPLKLVFFSCLPISS